MKKAFVCIFLFAICLTGCNKDEDWVCVLPSPSEVISVLQVDYTTNNFTGGYHIEMPLPIEKYDFELIPEYESPVDFGSITWYEKRHDVKLFSGTIIWMGKGERTFPEKILKASDFYFTPKPTTVKPQLIFLTNDGSPVEEWIPEIDTDAIWKSIASIGYVDQALQTHPEVPIYLYLYQPSVGIGDPKDWYWLVFVRNNIS